MDQTFIDNKLIEQLRKLSIQNVIKLLTGCNKKTVRITDIAKATNYKKGNIYKWERGVIPNNSTDVKETLIRFWMDSCKVLMSDKELEELGIRLGQTRHDADLGNIWAEPLIDYDQNSVFIGIPINGNGHFKVYKEGKVNAGTITEINGEPFLIAYQRDSYFTGDIDGQIILPDDSMEPEFRRGSVIGIRRIKFPKKYNSGYHYYVVDVNLHGMLRKLIRRSDDICVLKPENDKYPEFEKNIDDILAIFKVEGGFIKR